MPGTVFLGMVDQLADNIQLMITRENNLLGHISADFAIRQCDFLHFLLIADELLQNIQEFILLQYVFPQIGSHIAASSIPRSGVGRCIFILRTISQLFVLSRCLS